MFAESHATAEEKFLKIVVFAWCQRIAEPLCPEELKRAVYHGARVTILHPPGLCQLAHRRTDGCRHLKRFRSFLCRDLVPAEFR